MVQKPPAPGQLDPLFRPYAPPANISTLLQRLRRMNTPSRVTKEFLRGAGITENIVPRVMATLRFLQLIGSQEVPTDTLLALSDATEDEYRQILEQTLRTAYAEDFQNIDPTSDPQARIVDAFQRYTPKSQHDRQVILFLGLCREAGIQTADVPRERSMRSANEGQTTRRATPRGRRAAASTASGRQPRNRGGDSGEAAAEASPILGLTPEDAALMPAKEFQEAWSALGVVFRLRAQRQLAQQQAEADAKNQATEPPSDEPTDKGDERNENGAAPPAS